jgi:hypothetical protein
MFDIDEFVKDCIDARTESRPRLAIRDVLNRVMERPQDVIDGLPDIGAAAASASNRAASRSGAGASRR